MDKIRVVERMDDTIRLPLHLVLQDHAVCGVLGREGGATILHAEHNQRFAAIVVDGALAGRSYTHDASLLEGTYGKPDMVRGDKTIYRAKGLPGMGLIFEIEKGKIDEIEIGPIEP